MKKLFYIVLLLASAFVFAQNKGITYQAVIYIPGGQNVPGVNVSNVPMTNKSICLQFSFLDASAGLEYQEVIKTTTDEFGMVNITIGSGNQTGGYVSSFDAIVWSTTSKKTLKVALDATGLCNQFEALTDESLASVPFANAAITAENVSGVVAIANGGTGATTASAARTNLGLGNVENTSDLNKPMSTATKVYVDSQIISSTIPDATTTSKGKIQLAGDLAGTAAAPTVPGLALKANSSDVTSGLATKEDTSNKSTDATLASNSDLKFPTEKAVKTYVDVQVAGATIADASATVKGKIQLAGDLAGTAAAPTVPGLASKENAANKSTTTSLGTSDVLFPTQNAVKTYVDTAIAGATIVDADATTKGKLQLAGDLTGTAAAPVVANNAITDAKIANGISASKVGLSNVDNTSDANKPVSTATQTALNLKANTADVTSALALKEDTANKSTTTSLGTSDVLFPTQNAVKTYVDGNITTVTNAITAETTTARAAELVNATAITAEATTARAAESANATAIALKEDAANKSTTTTLGTSDVLFPTQNAVKTYVDAKVVDGITDAVTTSSPTQNAVYDALALKANLASPTFTGTVSGIDKTMVGLSNVDNTTDADKPVSTVTQAALDLKENLANKSIDIVTDGTSDDKYPSVKAIKNYVDALNAAAGVADGSITSAKIKDETIVDADVAANASIVYSKLNLGNSIVAADITTDAVETAKIKAAAVTDAKLDKVNIPLSGFGAAAADVALGSNKLTGVADPALAQDAATKNYVDTATTAITTLADGKIYLGNASNEATEVTLSGDVTISNVGVSTIGASKVLTGMIADDAITSAKITDANVTYAKIQNVSATDKVLGRVSSGAGVVEEIATTGSGNVVRATSPILVTPDLGVPSAVDLTNATALPLTLGVTGTLPVANGGTGVTSIAAGYIPFGNGTGALSSSSNFTWDNSNKLLMGVYIGRGADNHPTNTAYGFSNLASNNGGYYNVAIGNNSLSANTNASYNTGVGYSSLAANTSGATNTGIGYSSLVSNTTGGANNAFGFNALASNLTGSSNTAIGNNSLSFSTGDGNTAIGVGTLVANTSGTNNTAIGLNANVSANNLTNATAIGAGALVDTSNKIQLGDTSVSLVNTSGKFKSGAVTYPNTDGTSGQFLTTNGSGAASFASLPAINLASGVSGTLPVVNGGTGSTTQNFVDLTTDQTIAGVKTFSGSSTVVNQNLTVNAAGTSGQGIILSDDGDIVDNNDGAATFRFTGGVKINNGNGSAGTTTKITLDNTGNITATGGISGTQLTSTVATGTPPLVVTSTTPVANLNIGGNAATVTTNADLTGDVTSTGNATTVGKINGTSLAGLTTGILKNTTTTGVPSIAVAADFPTLNQNTTGTAANVTGTVAIANGGTGSTTQNFVDLTTAQTVAGAKTFSSDVIVNTIKIGRGPGQVASNLAFGQNALNNNTTGTNSIGIGNNTITGTNDTYNVGTNNIAIGNSAVLGGNYSIGIGFEALKQNSYNNGKPQTDVGNRNIAIGEGANKTSGQIDDNISIGYQSMGSASQYNKGNVAIGTQALFQPVGYHSDYISGYTVAIGYKSAYNTTSGTAQVFVGGFSGLNNTTGTQNIGIGYNTLTTNTTGSNNTAIGYAADVATSALSNATVIGYGATVNASNKIQLGNGSVTSVATSGALTTGAITYPNTAGSSGQVLTTNGSSTASWSAIPTTNLASGVTGTLPVANGGTGITSLTAGYIPFGNGTSALGSSANLFWDTTNTRLGIGTSSPVAKLEINSGNLLVGNNSGAYDNTNFVDKNAFVIHPYSGTTNLIATGASAGNWTSNIAFLTRSSGATAPSEAMRITGAGNLGIGTTSPSSKLHVVGNIKMVDGSQAAGNVLTSDANGLGTWTAIPATNLASGVTGILPGANGGTGVDNGTKTITLGGNLTTSGAFATTLTTTAATAVTLPTTGTLATLAGTETLTNKTLTSPTLTTPTLGVATATSVNKVNITAPTTSATLTIADGKTLTANNSIILAGTDATTMTFPSTTATIARTDAAQTFTGAQTFSSTIVGSINGNAATVTTNANLTGPITSVGNATSVASQTGTGTKFVMDTSPTLVTPVIGAATGTSLSVSGQLTSTVATGTAPLVVTSTTPVANLSIGGNAATATTATNLAGGAAGSIPYQTAAATTAMLAKGTDGQVLTLASGIPSWSYSKGTIVTTTNTAYPITLAEAYVFYAGVSAGALTIPAAATANSGKEIIIKNKSGFGFTITPLSGSIYIDNANSSASNVAVGIEASNNWVKLVSDGTQWIAFRALF